MRCVAVWDTVGSLGIPDVDILERLGLPRSTREFKFYDTSLSNGIEHAFQALALDEHRAPFSPAVWERPRGVMTELRQVWFPGCHSNVGGGSYEDEELANGAAGRRLRDLLVMCATRVQMKIAHCSMLGLKARFCVRH